MFLIRYGCAREAKLSPARKRAARGSFWLHRLANGAAELPYRQRIEREFQNDVDQAQREQDGEVL